MSSRKRTIFWLIVGALLLGAIFAFPWPRSLPIGLWKREAFYAGRPTNYWRGLIRSFCQSQRVQTTDFWHTAQRFLPVPLRGIGPSIPDSYCDMGDDPAAVPVLRELLAADDADVRAMTLDMLAEQGSQAEEAIPELTLALEDPVPDVRALAAKALCLLTQQADDVAVPILAKSLGEEHDQHLVWTQWQMKLLRSVHRLVRTMGRSVPVGGRDEILDTLGAIGPRASGAVPQILAAAHDPRLRKAALRALGNIGPAASEAIPVLRLALNSSDPSIAIEAAEALGKIEPGSAPAVSRLLAFLSRSEQGLRRQAASALGKVGALDPAVRTALQRAQADAAPRVRVAAAEALSRIDGEADSAIPVLRSVLLSHDVDAANDAARALGGMGRLARPAVPDLVAACNKKGPDTFSATPLREAAAEALGNIGPEAAQAIPVLRTIAATDRRSTRWAAARALRKIAPPQRPAAPNLSFLWLFALLIPVVGAEVWNSLRRRPRKKLFHEIELALAGRRLDQAKENLLSLLGQESQRTKLGQDAAEKVKDLGAAYFQEAKLAEAEALYRQYISLLEKKLGWRELQFGPAMFVLAGLLYYRGKDADGDALYQNDVAKYYNGQASAEHQVAWAVTGLRELLATIGAAECRGVREGVSIRSTLRKPNGVFLPERFDVFVRVCRANGEAGVFAAERALDLCQRLLNPENSHLAFAWETLAEVYEHHGRSEDATAAYRQCLAIRETIPSEDKTELPSELLHLAKHLRKVGQFQEAEQPCARALLLWKDAAGPESVEVAASLLVMGSLCHAQSRFAEAESAYRQAQAIWEKQPSPENAAAATCIQNIGTVRTIQADFAEAERLFYRALETLDNNSSSVARIRQLCLSNLGSLYCRWGKLDKAETFLKQAVDLCGKGHAENGPGLSFALRGLGQFHQLRGDFVEAKSLYDRVVALREEHLGQDHPDTTMAALDLARLARDRGIYLGERASLEYAEARARSCCTVLERVRGANNINMAAVCEVLARVAGYLGQTEEAERHAGTMLRLCESLLGPEHPGVGDSQFIWAELHVAQNRLAEAEPCCRRSLEIHEKHFGAAHFLAAPRLRLLGKILGLQGTNVEAERLLGVALHVQEGAFGPEHPQIGLTLREMADLLSRNGRQTDAEPLRRRADAIRAKALVSFKE
jgi:HEAT repeat protein